MAEELHFGVWCADRDPGEVLVGIVESMSGSLDSLSGRISRKTLPATGGLSEDLPVQINDYSALAGAASTIAESQDSLALYFGYRTASGELWQSNYATLNGSRYEEGHPVRQRGHLSVVARVTGSLRSGFGEGAHTDLHDFLSRLAGVHKDAPTREPSTIPEMIIASINDIWPIPSQALAIFHRNPQGFTRDLARAQQFWFGLLSGPQLAALDHAGFMDEPETHNRLKGQVTNEAHLAYLNSLTDEIVSTAMSLTEATIAERLKAAADANTYELWHQSSQGIGIITTSLSHRDPLLSLYQLLASDDGSSP